VPWWLLEGKRRGSGATKKPRDQKALGQSDVFGVHSCHGWAWRQRHATLVSIPHTRIQQGVVVDKTWRRRWNHKATAISVAVLVPSGLHLCVRASCRRQQEGLRCCKEGVLGSHSHASGSRCAPTWPRGAGGDKGRRARCKQGNARQQRHTHGFGGENSQCGEPSCAAATGCPSQPGLSVLRGGAGGWWRTRSCPMSYPKGAPCAAPSYGITAPPALPRPKGNCKPAGAGRPSPLPRHAPKQTRGGGRAQASSGAAAAATSASARDERMVQQMEGEK
jgi:hypothetical protein